MKLFLHFKQGGDMSKSLKQFLFFGYASIIAYNLYSSKAGGEPFKLIFLYLKVFFPLCAFIAYKHYISKDDLRGKDFLEGLGSIVFVISVPSLLFFGAYSFFLPYIWIIDIYKGWDIPPDLNFYLTLMTPPILLALIGLIYKNTKNKSNH